jgi:hypothetical protein
LPHDQEESVTNQATAHVLIAVTAPTAENATEWATTVSDLVQAEYGDTMRLAVRVSPPAAAPSAPADRAALRDRIAEALAAVLAECDAIEADYRNQHDEVAVGTRAAIIRIRARVAVLEQQPAVLPTPADRAALSARLWAVAEHNIIAEWICCEPINPKHELCVQGDATLRMVKALLVDDPEAIRPAPLLDAVLAVLPAPADRAAEWRAVAQRVRERAETCTSSLRLAMRTVADGIDCDADEIGPSRMAVVARRADTAGEQPAN